MTEFWNIVLVPVESFFVKYQESCLEKKILGRRKMRYVLISFSDPESQTLKEHLIDELDYVLVPTEAWNKLLNWYGCVEGQQPIVRKVST